MDVNYQVIHFVSKGTMPGRFAKNGWSIKLQKNAVHFSFDVIRDDSSLNEAFQFPCLSYWQANHAKANVRFNLISTGQGRVDSPAPCLLLEQGHNG